MPDNPNPLEMAINFGRTLDRAQVAEIEPRKSERDRLVWYVGISGYALFNATNAWTVLLGRPLTAGVLFVLSVPWMLAALTALLAHLMAAEWLDRDNLLFHAWRTEADRLVSLGKERPVSEEEVASLIKGSADHIARLKASSGRADWWAKGFRRAALLFLCGAFVWSLFGPSFLRDGGLHLPSAGGASTRVLACRDTAPRAGDAPLWILRLSLVERLAELVVHVPADSVAAGVPPGSRKGTLHASERQYDVAIPLDEGGVGTSKWSRAGFFFEVDRYTGAGRVYVGGKTPEAEPSRIQCEPAVSTSKL